ncbi:hypothetical protein DFJ77DRAFT_155819 [Powellomyces hirtus]|nr:hypothetical protein DFJ77DRAFT_155819 [Powellomyces hirtus]
MISGTVISWICAYLLLKFGVTRSNKLSYANLTAVSVICGAMNLAFMWHLTNNSTLLDCCCKRFQAFANTPSRPRDLESLLSSLSIIKDRGGTLCEVYGTLILSLCGTVGV